MRWARSDPLIGGRGRWAAILLATMLTGTPAATLGQDLPTAAAAEQSYDIPAQPLSTALPAFARMSGVDILYENGMAAGRTSAPLRGRMSPQAALRALLRGTGLSARFTEPRAAIVYLTAGPPPRAVSDAAALPELRLDTSEVRAPVVIGSPDRDIYQRYAQVALHDVRRLLSEDPDLRGRVFRLQVSLKVDPAGLVERVTLLRGSGDALRDAHIRRTLVGKSVTAPPPGLREPLYFEVTTDRQGRGR